MLGEWLLWQLLWPGTQIVIPHGYSVEGYSVEGRKELKMPSLCMTGGQPLKRAVPL